MILLTSPETAADRTEISVYGDLDVITGVELRRVLGALTEMRVELDLAHVTFLDCAGVRTLIWAHEHMRARGGSMVIVRPSDLVLRLLRLLEFDRCLVIHRSGGAIGADRTMAGD
ncbi:STAS domain-containing protein [Streptosporangium lutulentum]|uniref:Anti-anti-sigma factor n=1 Tax=Streptosporangium lutulentum TaxID=1461250 RepID=A0ABT9QNQ8_9ACTN|nr:STAS domain-containing protein [Streptosporangium lutulentum]MDP9848396.1 anti-anti-sigma factor [Streptosporangium lutulentum]